MQDFVVITGFSGAGKSQAMACFEDGGYFCVDNLPPGMIGSLADLFHHEGSKVERAAVVCDVRGGDYFGGVPQLLDGIREERELLEPLRARADVSIDTSDVSAARLRQVVADKMLPREASGRMAVTFLTYGFKHGAPRDADLAFDVRFLPNPHYEPQLRELTGLDPKVV